MILAEKIVLLRKQTGWSQEELAAKMNVSRQSVSKWEGTNSIPDLNKILLLAELFNVSTDYLLKDDVTTAKTNSNVDENKLTQISLEQALNYVDNKINTAKLISKGVFLCICCVLPMFALFALTNTQQFNLSTDIAAPIGIVLLLVMISFGVSFFIKSNQYKHDFKLLENGEFELAYGVHSIFTEKLQTFRPTYNLRLTISISMFMFSFVPLLFSNILYSGASMVLLMVMVMMLIIATGVYLLIPVTTRFDAYNLILNEGVLHADKSERTKRAEKLAAFYWPLIIAIYLAWSLWTMEWGSTWIIWPVSGILFAALVGLIELVRKEEH